MWKGLDHLSNLTNLTLKPYKLKKIIIIEDRRKSIWERSRMLFSLFSWFSHWVSLSLSALQAGALQNCAREVQRSWNLVFSFCFPPCVWNIMGFFLLFKTAWRKLWHCSYLYGLNLVQLGGWYWCKYVTLMYHLLIQSGCFVPQRCNSQMCGFQPLFPHS